MKKTIVVLALLLVTAAIFAATPLKFSGTYALFGNASGRTIRKATVDLDESGFVMATGKDEAAAYSDDFTLFLSQNTLVVVSNRDGLSIYVLFGQATVAKNAEKDLTIYTPTTAAELKGKGQFAVISTDSEERIYNYSRLTVTPYDALRHENVEVPSATGYDYLKRTLIPVDYSYAVTEGKVEKVVKIPAAPIMVETDQNLTVDESVPGIPVLVEVIQDLSASPSAPVMLEVLQSLSAVPTAPEGLVVEQKLTPAENRISVTQTLVYVPEKPIFAYEPTVEVVND